MARELYLALWPIQCGSFPQHASPLTHSPASPPTAAASPSLPCASAPRIWGGGAGADGGRNLSSWKGKGQARSLHPSGLLPGSRAEALRASAHKPRSRTCDRQRKTKVHVEAEWWGSQEPQSSKGIRGKYHACAPLTDLAPSPFLNAPFVQE